MKKKKVLLLNQETPTHQFWKEEMGDWDCELVDCFDKMQNEKSGIVAYSIEYQKEEFDVIIIGYLLDIDRLSLASFIITNTIKHPPLLFIQIKKAGCFIRFQLENYIRIDQLKELIEKS